MLTAYTAVKYLHIGCVVLAGAGFVLRGAWMMQGSPLLAHGWVRVLPHVVDTVLLASAVALSVMTEQYPLVHGWLTAKVFGLIAYIALGTMALKRGRTRGMRITAFWAAMLVFAYVVAVATTKSAVLFGG